MLRDNVRKNLSSSKFNFDSQTSNTKSPSIPIASLLLTSGSMAPCPFIRRLPLEMRHTIYDSCFPSNTIVYLPYDQYGRRTGHEARIKTVFLLNRTCRQIRAEVVPRCFANNMFSFATSYQMYRFAVNIGRDGREGREAIRQLEFTWGYEYLIQRAPLLKECGQSTETANWIQPYHDA